MNKDHKAPSQNPDNADVFVPTFSRSGAPLVRGEGMYLFDADGRRYLDFGAGIAVNALGHGHPAIIAALREQGSLLIHSSNLYFTQPQLGLRNCFRKKRSAARCFSATAAPRRSRRPSNSHGNGRRKLTKKSTMSCPFSSGFHGRTYGALSATAQEQFHEGFGPLLEGFHHAPFNDIAAAGEMLDKHDLPRSSWSRCRAKAG